MTIAINNSWCKSCGICVDFCPTSVLALDETGKLIIVAEEKCTKCRLCELRCPDLAIEIEGDEE